MNNNYVIMDTYEKKYKEALERAKKWRNAPNVDKIPTFANRVIEEIFPELCESEDEKIRKSLIILLQHFCKGYRVPGLDFPVSYKEMLAWLEKQGEQKPADKIEPNVKGTHEYFSDLLEKNDCDNIDDYASQCAYCMSHDWIKDTATWDDVEKACKLGAEWNEKHHSSAWSKEDEKMIGRIRGIIEAYAFSQSAVDVNGDLCEKKFIDVDIWLKSIKDRVYPKHEWKQENIDDLTDFENAMMHIGESFFGNNAGLDPNDTNAIKEQANILLGLVPSKEWSEEDEEFFNDIIAFLEDTKNALDHADWIKSLKQRICG